MKRKCYSISAPMLPWLILICGCLSACSGSFPWALASPTSTATSTVTPSITPSATPTLTFTPTPTDTPFPTATVTEAPTPQVIENMKEINGMHVYEDIDAMFKNVKELTPEEIKEITKNCEPKIGEAKRLQSGTIIQEMTVCGVDSEPVLVRYGSEDVLVLQQAVLGKFSDLRWALIMLGVKDKDDFRTMINNTGTKIKLDLDDNNIWEYFSKGNQFTLDIVRYMSEERSFELEKRSPDSMCYKLYREFFLEQEQVSPEMQKVFRTNDYVNLLIAGKALPKNIIFGLFNSVLTLP